MRSPFRGEKKKKKKEEKKDTGYINRKVSCVRYLATSSFVPARSRFLKQLHFHRVRIRMTLYTYFSHFIPLCLLYLLRFPIFMRVLHFYIYTLVYVLKFALSFSLTEEIPLFTPP